jgi:hypothetical protein
MRQQMTSYTTGDIPLKMPTHRKMCHVACYSQQVSSSADSGQRTELSPYVHKYNFISCMCSLLRFRCFGGKYRFHANANRRYTPIRLHYNINLHLRKNLASCPPVSRVKFTTPQPHICCCFRNNGPSHQIALCCCETNRKNESLCVPGASWR